MAGVKRIRNTEDMRLFALEHHGRGGEIVDSWTQSDYCAAAVRAAELGRTVRAYMKDLFAEEMKRRDEPETRGSGPATETLPETTGGIEEPPADMGGAAGPGIDQSTEEVPSEAPEKPRATKPRATKPRTRVREDGVSIEVCGTTLTLTPMQARFLYGLIADRIGVNSHVPIEECVIAFSGFMQAMTVGAMISTLREKGVLSVHTGILLGSGPRSRGRKAKHFKLTEIGAGVVEALIMREGGKPLC